MDHDQIKADTIREVTTTVTEEVDALRHLQEIAPTREVALAITNFEQGIHWLRAAGHGSWYDTPTEQVEEES